MIIPKENAFTINRLGGSFFPFSVKVDQLENVSRIFICAQRVVDVCDVIIKHSKTDIVLFGVGQTSKFETDTDTPMSLKALAEEADIPFSTVDSETIVIPKESILPLLLTFDHYNMCIFDIEGDWNESQVISQILAYREHKFQEQEPCLLKMPASRLFLTSHDDCYLTIESLDPDVSKEVFNRTLQTYACTYLDNRISRRDDFPDIPSDLTSLIWRDNFGITILEQNTEFYEGYLRIGLSLKPYNFVESIEYPSELWLVYDIQNHKWQC